jgi:hypothetical protein
MELAIHSKKLKARLELVEERFHSFQASRPSRLDHAQWMFLEGLSSATWQYWGNFCRSVVMDSALGTHTASGVAIPPCAGTWQEVSHIAICAANKKKPILGQINNDLHREPTWGDPSKLGKVINSLELGNKTTLASSFGAESSIPHLQTVRNAAAHRHVQNTEKVLSLSSYYLVSRLRHPVEALLWIEESSDNFAFLYWLEDMRILSELAVQ